MQNVVLFSTRTFDIIIVGGDMMPLKYKIDILQALKAKEYSAYRLAQEKILSGSSIQKLRMGEALGADGIATLCELLECQPGDILCYEPKKE